MTAATTIEEPVMDDADDQQEPVATVATPHRYIVVEGPIGVGKTSLVRRLGRSFGCELVLEQDAENPFLERFYRDPRSAAGAQPPPGEPQ